MTPQTTLPNPFNPTSETSHEYRGFFARVRFYTTEELKKIDETLPNTGASQKPGYFWDEFDGEDVLGAPSGPYKTREAAVRSWKQGINRIA